MLGELMTHALGICTAKKDLVTVALFAALADDDITVGVALCGVHGLVSFMRGGIQRQ
jgi:hypothetical protein